MQSEIGSNFWIRPEDINLKSSIIIPKQFGCNGSDYVWMSTARSATSLILDTIENRSVNVKNISLSNFDVMIDVAAEEGYIKPEDKMRLIAFRNNPSDESWIK